MNKDTGPLFVLTILLFCHENYENYINILKCHDLGVADTIFISV
jgi:hypothetical protein